MLSSLFLSTDLSEDNKDFNVKIYLYELSEHVKYFMKLLDTHLKCLLSMIINIQVQYLIIELIN